MRFRIVWGGISLRQPEGAEALGKAKHAEGTGQSFWTPDDQTQYTPITTPQSPPLFAHGRKTFKNVCMCSCVCVFGQGWGGWTFSVSERCLVSIRWRKETAAFPDNGSHSATPLCVLWITHTHACMHIHTLRQTGWGYLFTQTRGQRKPQWNTLSASRSVGPKNRPMKGTRLPRLSHASVAGLTD